MEPTALLFLSFLVAAGLSLLVAGALLSLNFADRLNRVFGLYLVLQGGFYLTRSFPSDPGTVLGTVYSMRVYLLLAAPFAILYLGASYRERFAGARVRRWALPVLAVAGLGVQIAYVIQPSLALLGASIVGPMAALVVWIDAAGLAVLSAFLARDALRAPTPERRRSLLLGSLGFAFFPMAYGPHFLIPGLMTATDFDVFTQSLTALPIAYVAFAMGRVAFPSSQEPLARDARRYLVVLAVPLATVALLAVSHSLLPLATSQILMLALMAAWKSAVALLVGYAIARHQLFDIDLRLKTTVRRGIITTFFLAAFLIGLQLAESFANDVLGRDSWIVGGVAAGLLVFALTPLQRLAHRASEVAIPGVDDSATYAAHRRLQVYEAAFQSFLSDGHITERERHALERLALKLAITPQDARLVERDSVATSAPAPEGPREAQTIAKTRLRKAAKVGARRGLSGGPDQRV